MPLRKALRGMFELIHQNALKLTNQGLLCKWGGSETQKTIDSLHYFKHFCHSFTILICSVTRGKTTV